MVGAEHALLVGQQRLEQRQRSARIATLADPMGDLAASIEGLPGVSRQPRAEDPLRTGPRGQARARQQPLGKRLVQHCEGRAEQRHVEQPRFGVGEQDVGGADVGGLHRGGVLTTDGLRQLGGIVGNEARDDVGRLLGAARLVVEVGEQGFLHLAVEAVALRADGQDVAVGGVDQIVETLDRDALD